MTSLRKVAALGGGLLAVLVLAVAAVPLLFKDRIVEAVRVAVGDAVAAEVRWSDADVSLLRTFPNLGLRLEGLSVVGEGGFAGDTLVSMDGFRLTLALGSVVRVVRGTGGLVVRSVRIDGPALHLRVTPEGEKNWDLVGGDEATGAERAPARSFALELRSLVLDGGRVTLDDARSGVFASVEGLRHTSSGDLSRDRFVLRTSTHADATTLRFAGMPYLERTTLDFEADIDADLTAGRFVFEENELTLNELVVRFAGSAERIGDDIALDLTFDAPRADFAQILSLVPVVYARDFHTLETAGSVTVGGRIGGRWGEDTFPSFALTADVADGRFKYPDLPLPARDISFHLEVTNPGGDVDSTTSKLERFHVRIGDEPVTGSLTLRTPVSDPDVDLEVRGVVDLADLPRVVKLDDVQELTGVVRADAAMSARLSDLDAARYDRVAARGSVQATGVTLRAETFPQPIEVEEATLALTPRRVELRSLDMRLGSSDFRASGALDNVLGFLLRGEDLSGSATFSSSFVGLDEWKSDDELELIAVPAGIAFDLNGTVDRLTLGELEMTEARGRLLVRDRRLTLDDFGLRTLGGRVVVNGEYETLDPTRPTFRVGIALDSVDIPRASGALRTVRLLAPVARFARGAFSARLDLSGALGSDMLPELEVLDGAGSLQTTQVALEGFPALERLATTLELPQLARPVLNAVRSSISIREGRLHVRPMQVSLGAYRMGVAGSHGIDQTLDYRLTLSLPRAALGDAADRAVRGLIQRAGRAGVDLAAADSVEIGVGLGGTVTVPSLETDFRGLVTSTVDRTREAVGAAIEQRLDDARERVDSLGEESLRRARAQADSIVAAAERQAATVRAEARRLADEVRAEATRRAEEVVAEARNPVARAAARVLADRIRKEADERASAAVAEADRRADELVEEARARAEEMIRGAGG